MVYQNRTHNLQKSRRSNINADIPNYNKIQYNLNYFQLHRIHSLHLSLTKIDQGSFKSQKDEK